MTVVHWLGCRRAALGVGMVLSLACALPEHGRAAPVEASGPYAAYLAAEIAQAERDPPTALAFYQQALGREPANQTLRLRVFTVALAEGAMDQAVPLARKLVATDPALPLPTLLLAVEAVREGKADDAAALARALPESGFYRYVRGFTGGWATYEGKHDAAAAIHELYATGDNKALGPLMPLQAALMADIAGDRPEADRSYAQARAAAGTSLRLTQLYGNYLERTGRIGDAKSLYDAFLTGAQPEAALVPKVTIPGPPAAMVTSAREGLAEALYELSGLMGQDAAPEVAQLLIRLSLHLRPGFPQAALILADALETQHRGAEAIAVLHTVDHKSPFAFRARLREADLLAATGDLDTSIKALKGLAADAPGQPEPTLQLANELREHDRFAEAITLYDQVLSTASQPAPRRLWSVYFSRAVAHDRSGDWAAAEADLRHALDLAPDEPEVLNYLGYALVDRQQKLDEATDLIRHAVDLRPDDGYIVDSLGWALYRQGKTEDAESTLERAVELRPGDPDINDHLGDVYWQGGKTDEARLQWRRALSLKPAAPLAKTIETKLNAHKPPVTTTGGL